MMSPELARRLAFIFPTAAIRETGVTGVAGVAKVARYASKPAELRQLRRLRRLRHEIGNAGEPTNEGVAAYLDVPDGDLADAIAERAGLATDSVPALYLDAWARLNCQKPASVCEADWRLALDDGGRFLDFWGSEAAELRWTPAELFDVTSGLVWRLASASVEALGPQHVRLSDGRTEKRSAGCLGGGTGQKR